MPTHRSSQWYSGTDRNAYIHRAWMRRGLPAHAFDGRPHIAIANSASDLTPCNAHLDEVASLDLDLPDGRPLRQEIEPVSSKDFLRFLFRWQHITPGEQRQGPDALDAIIAQLQGFEAPAAAWESEILPARLARYQPSSIPGN